MAALATLPIMLAHTLVSRGDAITLSGILGALGERSGIPSVKAGGGGGGGGSGGDGCSDCGCDCDCSGNGSDCTGGSDCVGAGNSGDCCGGCSCFTVGTEVTLADGTVKKIEDIEIGDILLGADLE